MGNRNRDRGDYLERQTKAALEAFGWVVVRAAGSLGAADLLAIRAGFRPLLVACKITGYLLPAERRALIEWAAKGDARALMAQRTKPGRVGLWEVHEDAKKRPPVDELPAPRKGPAHG